jgi:hypothetical protein
MRAYQMHSKLSKRKLNNYLCALLSLVFTFIKYQFFLAMFIYVNVIVIYIYALTSYTNYEMHFYKYMYEL